MAATASSQPCSSAREPARRRPVALALVALVVRKRRRRRAAGGEASFPRPAHRVALSRPGTGSTESIIAAIDGAKHEVMMLAYSFTAASPGARRVAQARGRGAGDRRSRAGRALPQNVLADLATGGVDVWLDGNFQAAHNKVVIVDADAAVRRRSRAATTSRRRAAAQRRECRGAARQSAVARAYRDNWSRLKACDACSRPRRRSDRSRPPRTLPDERLRCTKSADAHAAESRRIETRFARRRLDRTRCDCGVFRGRLGGRSPRPRHERSRVPWRNWARAASIGWFFR